MAYDAIAFYTREGREALRCEFAAGLHCGGLWGLRVPVGTGLVGWVAEAGRPIVNGNLARWSWDMSETGMLELTLQSALAIPIEGGVLALYRTDRDAFAGQDVTALEHLHVARVFIPAP